jgi:hypothetical protein
MVEYITNDSGSLGFLGDELVEQIPLNEMVASDQILMRTRQSVYLFSVTNANHCLGTLSGGSLGEESWEAVLIGSASQDSGNEVTYFDRLKIGARAVFFVYDSAGTKRVITSEITRLRFLKADGNSSLN